MRLQGGRILVLAVLLPMASTLLVACGNYNTQSTTPALAAGGSETMEEPFPEQITTGDAIVHMREAVDAADVSAEAYLTAPLEKHVVLMGNTTLVKQPRPPR